MKKPEIKRWPEYVDPWDFVFGEDNYSDDEDDFMDPFDVF
jgi:hypothetical protein